MNGDKDSFLHAFALANKSLEYYQVRFAQMVRVLSVSELRMQQVLCSEANKQAARRLVCSVTYTKI